MWPSNDQVQAVWPQIVQQERIIKIKTVSPDSNEVYVVHTRTSQRGDRIDLGLQFNDQRFFVHLLKKKKKEREEK